MLWNSNSLSGNGNILYKYIHGPRVDEPVCMKNVAANNAVSYYHFDGLGSVVALSNSYGNSIQSYEYSIYGQVAAEDPNHTNPYMFTGRRFDFETGLYYYRARYYNPYIGRFLQTDPVGYSAGMNLYAYCRNNPLNMVDPSGNRSTFGFGVGRISYILAGTDEKKYLKVHNAEEFIEWLEGLRDANDRITFFEFVGHGERVLGESDAVGLTMGNDVFGVFITEIDEDEDGVDDWYSIYDYASLLQEVFVADPCDPCDVVLIELEACYSAGTIGKAFKKILPDATVMGYTGICEPYWPFYYWEATGWGWEEVKL